MSKRNIDLTLKVWCKEFLLTKDIEKILIWINVRIIDTATGARDLRTIFHDALKELLNSPYTKLPDDKNELFRDILDEYNTTGSLDSFKIYESPIVGKIYEPLLVSDNQ